MVRKIIPFILLFSLVASVTIYHFYPPSSNAISEITCPLDESVYIWTPIGTFSENFHWICFQYNHTWIETYPKVGYEDWRNIVLEPIFVRDYTLLYLRTELHMDLPNPLILKWTGGRETPDNLLGYETYIYRAQGLIITVGYPLVLPENTTYKITVQRGDRILWDGTLHRRVFTTYSPPQNTIYNSSGGVGLFKQGIHIIATDFNPMIREVRSDALNTSDLQNEYWNQLKEHVTLQASTEDFISIILSRGDHPTGGYGIHVTSMSWLESYPVQFRFIVDFTNPADDVPVIQVFTNPLVLIPLGTLTPGNYLVEVNINTYILTFDDQGNLIYTLLQTFKAEQWTLTFSIN
jgi:hypothetical protein